VSNEGVKCLTDTEIVAEAHGDITTVHRRSVRGLRKIAAVREFDKLSDSDRIKHNAFASVLGVLGHVTRTKQVALIEAAVSGSQQQLAVNRTLRALLGAEEVK
jgi:hypothetical protein